MENTARAEDISLDLVPAALTLFGILATQIFARPLPTLASHVLQVPSLQSYTIGTPDARATSRRL